MTADAIKTVAVVGTGVIGRSWIRVFIRAGLRTQVFDMNPTQLDRALDWVGEDLQRDVEAGTIAAADAEKQHALVTRSDSLKAALDAADYVQESGPEDLALKQAIYASLDHAAHPACILASSTSGFDMTEIAAGLDGAGRCVVAHPTNPPHVVPAVEVLGGKATRPEVTERTIAFLRNVGQTPVVLNFWVDGFLLNRLQAALIREAFNLVQSGVADPDAVDAVVRDGLGLRWALMGPFGVANTNADGGLREYFTRFRESYIESMNDLKGTPPIDDEFVEKLGQAVDEATQGTSVSDINRWRDVLVRQIRTLKQEQPEPWKA